MNDSAEQSVLLRYLEEDSSGLLTREDVAGVTQKEGMRLLYLGEYHDVLLYLLDESTCMQTGTHKSLDGCVTTALCKKKGITQVVFSSGANGGTALTSYARKTGLETYFFCPQTTLYKLDASLFDSSHAHLISVQGSDRTVKEAARIFAEKTHTPLVPTMEWRLLSAGYRALFVAEKMEELGHGFDWFAQTICAGYGPIGFYKKLPCLTGSVPKFLGIQQAALSPLVCAWKEGHAHLPVASFDGSSEPMIEPALYNTYPQQTYPLLFDLLNQFGGDLLAVSHLEFQKHAGTYTALLQNAGITITIVSSNGKSTYLENAGLLAGAGMLKAIEDGLIRKGERVLCSLSGGAGPAPKHKAKPDWIIRLESPLELSVQAYCDSRNGLLQKENRNAH